MSSKPRPDETLKFLRLRALPRATEHAYQIKRSLGADPPVSAQRAGRGSSAGQERNSGVYGFVAEPHLWGLFCCVSGEQLRRNAQLRPGEGARGIWNHLSIGPSCLEKGVKGGGGGEGEDFHFNIYVFSSLLFVF